MLLLGGDSSSRVGTYESRSYFILFVIFFATIAMLKIEIATCNTKFTKVVSVLFKKTNSSTRPMRILFSCQVSRFEFETSNSQTDRHSKYKKRQNCILDWVKIVLILESKMTYHMDPLVEYSWWLRDLFRLFEGFLVGSLFSLGRYLTNKHSTIVGSKRYEVMFLVIWAKRKVSFKFWAFSRGFSQFEFQFWWEESSFGLLYTHSGYTDQGHWHFKAFSTQKTVFLH